MVVGYFSSRRVLMLGSLALFDCKVPESASVFGRGE